MHFLSVFHNLCSSAPSAEMRIARLSGTLLCVNIRTDTRCCLSIVIICGKGKSVNPAAKGAFYFCLCCGCSCTALGSSRDGQQGVVHIFGKDAIPAGRVVDKHMGHTMIPMETYQDCIEYYTICEENTQNKKTENQAKRCFDDAEDIRKESIQ